LLDVVARVLHGAGRAPDVYDERGGEVGGEFECGECRLV
jgi:hypothetical protein